MVAKSEAQGSSTRGLSAGLTFAAVVALFTWGGLWLDEKVGTKPLFVLLGVFLGLLGGTIHMLRVLAPGQLPFVRGAAGQGPGAADSASSDPRGAPDSVGAPQPPRSDRSP